VKGGILPTGDVPSHDPQLFCCLALIPPDAVVGVTEHAGGSDELDDAELDKETFE
jgi:hypothetical protein